MSLLARAHTLLFRHSFCNNKQPATVDDYKLPASQPLASFAMQQSRVAGRTIGHRTTAADTEAPQTGQRIMMIESDAGQKCPFIRISHSDQTRKAVDGR